MNTPYEAFLDHMRHTSALASAQGVLSWDQEVMMPPKGADQRADQMAALETAIHARRTDPQLGAWLDELERTALKKHEARNVELARRIHERAVLVPADLAADLARMTARAIPVWAQARKDRTYADFAPVLADIIRLKREEADAIRDAEQSRYDALLNDFEPGMTVDVLYPLLTSLRPRLSALVQRHQELASGLQLRGPFARAGQLDLANRTASALGYDFEAGRLDLSTHPFSSGSGGDARITTRIDEANPLDCLYSTIHEVGHALYEQGVPSEHFGEPIGSSVSMGVHESQSRLWENQIGRSPAFVEWLWPHFGEAFPNHGLSDAKALYSAINQVDTGFIRTEADEVHYNLHVLLRFELEQALIAGDLEAGDLEAAWNDKFKSDFGLEVPHCGVGVLQDIHWAAGLFGYFPTYALGNIYAAQLHSAMAGAVGNLDSLVQQGDFAPVLSWLRTHVHGVASRLEPAAVIEAASGQSLSAEPLLAYLEAKYGVD